MIRDILTVARKEWMQVLFQRASLKGGIIAALVLPLLVLGVWLPAQSGREWVTSGLAPLMWTWFPMFICIGMICDAFAGERERHTLETLLASRLSDTSILLGKIAGAVGYGWGLSLAGLILSLITVNVAAGGKEFLMFAPEMAAATLLLSLLGAALSASAGVLVSLRASTVKQAHQTMSLALMIVIFGVGFGVRALPAQWQQALVQLVTGSNLVKTEMIAGLVLATADAALILAAKARFRRARLVLD